MKKLSRILLRPRNEQRDLEDKMKRSNVLLVRVIQGEEEVDRAMSEEALLRISAVMKDTALQTREVHCIPDWKSARDLRLGTS